jgi:glutaredoxin
LQNYKEKDAGKVVVYTTTMGILRETYQACMKVKQILRTLLVKFEERDVFMSNEYQNEIRERMRCEHILVPQVFVDGQHVGDAETIERLNETGELRRILKPFKVSLGRSNRSIRAQPYRKSAVIEAFRSIGLDVVLFTFSQDGVNAPRK